MMNPDESVPAMDNNSFPPERKQSSVMAWLGFGISIGVLLLIWIVGFLVITRMWWML